MYILTYGSLRKGEYNYDYFKLYYKKDFEYITTLTLKGYDLYSLGAYPAIKISKNPNTLLTVDLIKLSEEAKRVIDNMEFGAGYSAITKIIEFNDKTFPCTLYVYDENISKNRLISSGDWSEFKQQK
jgi:gamma-glutamylcyclotransferase (GGCT)/AIG2-like uncharacterized protein YtfP